MTKILIVEDEKKIAELLSDYLRQTGYETHILLRGDEVIPWVKKNEVEMILLDLMLPGMHGIEVCRGFEAIFPSTDHYGDCTNRRNRPLVRTGVRRG